MVIPSAGTDKMLQPPDAVERALALAAGIAVVDKERIDQRIKAVEKKMVDDPVAETGGKNFTLDRLISDKTGVRAGPVNAGRDLFGQSGDVVFQVHFENQLALGAPLMPPRLEIGAIQFNR